MDFFKKYGLRMAIAAIVMLWLKFLLIPTAMVFYELHHATGIDGIYWGYSVFKAAGYYFGVWKYQSLACVVVGVMIAVPWVQLIKRFFGRGVSV